MKYETKTTILNEEEKKEILKKLISIDSHILKKVYDGYFIPYDENFKILKIENGFNKNFYDEKMANKFYFTFTKERIFKNDTYEKEIFIYNDSRCRYISDNKNVDVYYFNKWNDKRNIDKLRQNKNNIFYVFDGVVSSKVEERQKTKQFYNKNIDLLRFNKKEKYCGNMTKFEEPIYKYYKKFYDVEIEKEICKSGYLKSDKIRKLKAKTRELKRERKQKQFDSLDKQKFIEELTQQKNKIMVDITKKINFEDYGLMSELYSYYNDYSIYNYLKLYNSIIKMEYKNIDAFYYDYNKIKTFSSDVIIESIYKIEYAKKIRSVNNLSYNLYINDIAKEIIILNDYILYNNKKYDKITFKEITENENI